MALILDMDDRIDGITSDLSEVFSLGIEFIKMKKIGISKICSDASLLCENLNTLIRQNQMDQS